MSCENCGLLEVALLRTPLGQLDPKCGGGEVVCKDGTCSSDQPQFWAGALVAKAMNNFIKFVAVFAFVTCTLIYSCDIIPG